MSTIFCCSSLTPYRPRKVDHESKFTTFVNWASTQSSAPPHVADDGAVQGALYAIQLVRQINYGPQEFVRYFVLDDDNNSFCEATEDSLIKSNFEKVNSYKNFKCNQHNKFFEINLYQKNAVNTHHWRNDLARPARDIDLTFRNQIKDS